MNCPNCGCETEQEMVDVGVGMVPCGPYVCPMCFWLENILEEDIFRCLDDTHDLV